MSKVTWTEDQKLAIDTRYKNILVSAAAGSGKTAVLVERIIKIITNQDNPVDIDRLLIVTFTNAAAAEMRERIGEAINQKIKENPDSRNLQKQLILLNKASISTLHSFCLNLIKNNFHQLDMEPNFRVGDTTEINLLKAEALEELLEDKYNEGDEEFLRLVESYCDNKSDRAIGDIIMHLYNFSMSMSDPAAWLNKSAEAFNVGEKFSFSDLPFKNALVEEAQNDIIRALEINNRAMDYILGYEYLQKYVPVFEGDGEILEKALMFFEKDDFSDIGFFENTSFSRMPVISKLNDEEKAVQEKAKGYREDVKEIWNQVKSRITNAASPEIAKITGKLYPLMKELSSLVIEYKNKFQEKKRERGIIDFNDQEHFALSILEDPEDNSKPSAVSLELRKKYDEILVDEYQDSNNVQEKIITLICRYEKGQRNVFMVGDLKQSIYRFRMAKPELFKDKKGNYPKGGDELNELITLHKNFRSRDEVIKGINYIFRTLMSETAGELVYDEDEELKTGADYPDSEEVGTGGLVELNLIDLDDHAEEPEGEEQENDADEEPDMEELDAMQLEARLAADRIFRLIKEEKVYDRHAGGYRNATYKDIVILLRSSNKLSPIFIEEFKKAGIPLFSEGGGGYFETLEIKTILSILEIIDNPIQDIPMIAAMRSPIGGFTTEELADIRIFNKGCSFYDAMISVLNNKKPEKSDDIIDRISENINLKKKIQDFIDKIEKWRFESKYTPINKLIWDIITSTGYYGYVGALPGGEQRQANLKILFKRAKDFERTSYKGLYSFIYFIHNVRSNSEDMGSAKIIGENENVVRIMSIHKSKGLEFPIVLLCGMSKRFNEGDLKGKILFHQELGFGPTYIDLDNRISFNTSQREFIGKKIKSENMSEEMRLLYVALTRAKEKLILVGSSKKLAERIEKWAEARVSEGKVIDPYYVKQQNNYLDWAGTAIVRHECGEKLRHYGENLMVKDIIEDKSVFNISIYQRSAFEKEIINTVEEKTLEEKLAILISDISMEADESINSKLNFDYPYMDAVKLPTVVTVTELKEAHSTAYEDTEEKLLLSQSDEFKTPSQLMRTPGFLQERKGLTPSEVGTAYHSIMQKLSLAEDMTMDNIQRQVQLMVDRELITFEEYKAVNLNKIEKFYQSEMGQMVIAADRDGRLKRELPFRIEIPPVKMDDSENKSVGSNDKMLLRGVIDCYIDNGDEGIIIDYKTDYVPKGNTDEIVERYRIQLEYYEKAVKKVFAKKTINKFLYLFNLDNFVKIE